MDIKLKVFKLQQKENYYRMMKLVNFFIRADLIVSKGKKKFIAEVKSGKAASIEEINTRRQLLNILKYLIIKI